MPTEPGQPIHPEPIKLQFFDMKADRPTPRRWEYPVGGVEAYITAINSAKALWGEDINIVGAYRADRVLGDIEIAYVENFAYWTRFTDSVFSYRMVTDVSAQYPPPMLYVRRPA